MKLFRKTPGDYHPDYDQPAPNARANHGHEIEVRLGGEKRTHYFLHLTPTEAESLRAHLAAALADVANMTTPGA